MFSPATRSESPVISTVASGSVVVTSTWTDSVPAAISIDSPSTTSMPSIKICSTEVSVLRATFRVT